jgi:autotransporter-associated beta strand protein
MKTVSQVSRTVFVSLAFCTVLLAVSSRGNTLIWTGGGGANANWSFSSNWGGGPTPNNGDTLIFKGATGLLNTNDISSLTLSQISFGGGTGGFDLRGNAFTVTNSIMATNSAGTNTIENSITLATNDVLMTVSNNAGLILNGNLSGSVGVNKTGLGTLIYHATGLNLYSGTTLVSAGTLQLNVSGSVAYNGPLVIGDGTGNGNPTVQLLASTEMPITPTIINYNGKLDLNNHTQFIGPSLAINGGYITTGSGTLTLSANTTIMTTNIYGDSPAINGNLSASGGTLTFRGNDDLNIFANVSGSANIVVDDLVQIDLDGANTFMGSLTCNDSSLADLGSSTALGNVTNTMTINGQAGVIVDIHINITNQSLTINGGNSFASLYIPDFNGPATNTWQANFILNSASLIKIETNCALFLNGPISGTGGFTKAGPGTLTFAGSTANSYSGTTIVTNGTLLLGKPSTVTAIPGALVLKTNTTVRLLNSYQIDSSLSSITMSNSSLLDLAGFNDSVGPITMQGAQITSGTGNLIFTGNITVNASTVAQSLISGNATIWNGTCTITNSGAFYSPDLRVTANISSGGGGGQGLIKDGAGEVALVGSNSFTGPVTVNNGDLWLETSTALGNTNTIATVNSGGSLYLFGNGLDFGLKPLSLNGTGYAFGAAFCSGSCSWGGVVTLAGNSTVYEFTGSSLKFTGAVGGAGGLIQAGPGTNILSGLSANNYAGTTIVGGGTLVLNKSSGTAVPGNLVINNTAVVRLANFSQQTATTADVLVNSGGLLDLSTNSTYVDTLRGSGTVNFGSAGWLVVGDNNGSSEFDGSFTGIGFGPGFTVGKAGTGTFTIGGNSSYTAGITHLITGKLVINGSQPLIPVTVDSGSTLAGSGTVGYVIANGTISPGNNPGILNSSNVIFSASGALNVFINGPAAGTGYSLLNVTGAVSLASAVLQVTMGTVGTVNSQYTLINNDSADAVSGTFAGLPEGAAVTANNGVRFTISYHGGTGNDVVLTQTNLPPQPVLAGGKKLPNGSMQLNGVGITNLSYTVWANTNLCTTNWISIGSVGVPANTNAFQFTDTGATNFPVQFYRLSWP